MSQEVIKKNHMDVAWHEYTDENGENVPVVDSYAGLISYLKKEQGITLTIKSQKTKL